MKSLLIARFLLLALVLAIPAVGCKKKPANVTPLPGSRSGVGGEGAAELQPGGTLDGTDMTAMGGGEQADLASFEGMNMDRDALASFTVYFGFDSSVVQASEEPSIDAVADTLRSDSSYKLLIEGHCDERGTEEYNRALGERRALALREALVSRGISGDRVRTLSYGEDKPADAGHDEMAWAKNRRGEFVLLTP